MITQFNAESARILHAAIDEALKAVATTHGLSYVQARATFDPHDSSMRGKWEFKVPSIGGVDRARHEFNVAASGFGLKPEHYQAKFTNKGQQWELTGLLPRRKFCLLARRVSDGKEMMFTSAVLPSVKEGLLAGPLSGQKSTPPSCPDRP